MVVNIGMIRTSATKQRVNDSPSLFQSSLHSWRCTCSRMSSPYKVLQLRAGLGLHLIPQSNLLTSPSRRDSNFHSRPSWVTTSSVSAVPSHS